MELSRQQGNTCSCNRHSIHVVTRSCSSIKPSEDPQQSAAVRSRAPPSIMEPVFAVAQEPPRSPMPPQHRLGQTPAQRGGARCVLAVALFLVFTGGFAFAAYRARSSSRDLAFVIVAYYLLALLLCCVAKLEQLRRSGDDDDHPAAAVAAERRRVRVAVWAVSVALANTFASRVADAMPGLALKLAVWGITAVVLGLGFYFLFFSKGDEGCDAESGGSQADDGHLPEMASHELSPEQKVRMWNNESCRP